eukprot:TRINITY_DN69680_c0_g1_i1.p1 TRINITY_DN69680_c0_g1~~TRINITY_DN69680_c0_g1_i1.p1  ORF type:complete len:172 (-),score=30.07 TRINITY_DN69680_c0_g1_i1:32-547(-)
MVPSLVHIVAVVGSLLFELPFVESAPAPPVKVASGRFRSLGSASENATDASTYPDENTDLQFENGGPKKKSNSNSDAFHDIVHKVEVVIVIIASVCFLLLFALVAFVFHRQRRYGSGSPDEKGTLRDLRFGGPTSPGMDDVERGVEAKVEDQSWDKSAEQSQVALDTVYCI